MEMNANKYPDNNEQSKTVDYEALLVAPDGLGFGEGDISAKQRLEDPRDPLTPGVMTTVHDTVTQGEILIPISRDEDGQLLTDDGCGDGRGVNMVMRGVNVLKKSLNRAKVFGGGLTMGIAARIGLGKADGKIKSLYMSEADKFKHFGIDYGAHIDEDFGEKNSGCGAIDKAPENIENVTKYKKQIVQTIDAVSSHLFAEEDLDDLPEIIEEVFSNYKDYHDEHSNEDHAGAEIIDVAAEEKKVVKELDSKEGHREVAIVLNLVPDMTVDQELVRERTNNVAQVFGVDIPRLQKIANRRYSDEKQRKTAFVSMLAYTLSTAATLTDGTLPVYMIKPRPASAA